MGVSRYRVTTVTVAGEPVWGRDHARTKGLFMGNFRKSTAAVHVLLLAGLAIATPAAAATFDGEWNVQIASSHAACSGGTSVSVRINNGQVASTSVMVTASGRVAEAGIISVTLASGMKRAVGFGPPLGDIP